MASPRKLRQVRCGGGSEEEGADTCATRALASAGGVSLSPSPLSHGSTAERSSTTSLGLGLALGIELTSG